MINLRFFTQKQFETAIAAIDVLLPADDRILSPEQVALRADTFLAAANAPSGEALGGALDLLDTAMPLLIGALPPFSGLSAEQRKQILVKVVAGKGQLRDLARALKLITVFSYYTDETVRQTIGYVEFEQRPRFPMLDITPHMHEPPNR
jgi:hypothetical protein